MYYLVEGDDRRGVYSDQRQAVPVALQQQSEQPQEHRADLLVQNLPGHSEPRDTVSGQPDSHSTEHQTSAVTMVTQRASQTSPILTTKHRLSPWLHSAVTSDVISSRVDPAPYISKCASGKKTDFSITKYQASKRLQHDNHSRTNEQEYAHIHTYVIRTLNITLINTAS